MVDRMNKEILDYRINQSIVNRIDKAIADNDNINPYKNYENRSKLLDVGLTIIFGNTDFKNKAFNDISCNDEDRENFSRTTFTIVNPIAAQGINETSRFEKAVIIEYALKFVTRELLAGNFKKLMQDYINAGGVLL